MNGWYLVDKPLGVSSFDVIRRMRQVFGTRRMGHTGTLDPLASGAMIIAVGNYTKLISYLESASKTYEFDVMLDGVTASYDLAEPVEYISDEQKDHYRHALTEATLQSILSHSFSGEIEQTPPSYSALKVDGKRAYSLARAGAELEMKTRKVTIHKIEIRSYVYPCLRLRAEVSAGTYIRSIASELGEMLESGGYVSRLRRTQIGGISLPDDIGASTKDDLGREHCIPLKISDLFAHIPCIHLSDEILSELDHGRFVSGEFGYPQDKDMFVVDEKDNILFVVRYNGEYLRCIRKI